MTFVASRQYRDITPRAAQHRHRAVTADAAAAIAVWRAPPDLLDRDRDGRVDAAVVVIGAHIGAFETRIRRVHAVIAVDFVALAAGRAAAGGGLRQRLHVEHDRCGSV